MRSVKWQRWAWIALVLALPACIIYQFYAKVFACPECYLFLDSGDGLKNYYTLAYYVLHDTGWHFTGMNYPYGENIIYTDNQPLLAMILRWVHHHVIPMDTHIIGTMNMLLMLSLYTGVLITYKLLRSWQAGKWWALASALCIIFLSPQVMRFGGHYALGYVCFIPALLLMLDRIARVPGKRWIWGVALGLFILGTSLIHMYFLFLELIVVAGFLVFWAWYNRRDKPLLKSVGLTLLGVILIPGAVLLGIRKYTDPIQDRPTEPWGIDSHCLNFTSTFFSFSQPFDETWTTYFGIEKPIMEKIAYTGLVGFIMLPAILIFLFRKKDENPVTPIAKAFIGAAILAWCMGAGVFYQHGFKYIWDAIPVLKQFRGLGRFGIPFYYLYTIVCCYLLWLLYVKLKERGLGNVGGYILGIAFIVWGFEARAFMTEQAAPIFRVNTTLHSSKEDFIPMLSAAGHTPDDFQAILQFPIVAIGNEMMGVTRGFWALRQGIHASWETGLPLIDYAMSRTSVSQGVDFVELISTPYAPKRRAQLFNDKPILLLVEEDEIIPAETKWRDMATKIGERPPTSLYLLPAAAFKTIVNPLENIQGDRLTCSGWFVDFENHPCDTAMSGSGALPIPKAETSVWSYPDTASMERQWILSLWTYVDKYQASVAVPRIMEKNPEGVITQNTGLHRDNIKWSEAYGDWMEINFPMTTKGKGYTYELFIDNAGPVIDNLLIRAPQDTCIHRFPEMTLFNNLPIPAK